MTVAAAAFRGDEEEEDLPIIAGDRRELLGVAPSVRSPLLLSSDGGTMTTFAPPLAPLW